MTDGRSFDHLDRGTPEARWSTSPLGGLEPLDAPGPGDRLVVIAAHPDDETLGAGGLISLARRRGAEVAVVVATDGDRSHPGSVTHTPAQLAVIRRDEVRAAVETLAPDADLHVLGLPDGALSNYHETLDAAVEHLVSRCTLLVSPWTGDRHPDHEACGRVAAAVAARHGLPHWQYPIWLWHWADPDSDDVPWARLRRLPLTAADVAAKQAAVARYVSQHQPLSAAAGDEAVLPDHVLRHFDRGAETFVVAHGGPCPDGAADRGDASAPGYFDRVYAADADPWQFETRFYERRKRELLLASLPRTRFRRVFEPGCATGLLTERLRARCDELVAWDVADAAVAATRQRLGQDARVGGPAAHDEHTATVEVARGRIPDEWPAGRFDLVVLSEVAYYCPDLDALVARVLAGLTDDGVVVACSWRQPAPDHPHTAEVTHAVIGRSLPTLVSHVEDDFLLHVWARDPRSVAVVEGIVA